MKRLLMVLALAGFAAACGDDDDDSSPGDGGGGTPDSGLKDSGTGMDSGTGGGADAGPKVNAVTNAGAACTVATKSSDCMGSAAECKTMTLLGTQYPGGICSYTCKADVECGPGGACPLGEAAAAGQPVTGPQTGAVTTQDCYKTCTAQSDCRPGYICATMRQVFMTDMMLKMLFPGPLPANSNLDKQVCVPGALPDAGAPDAGRTSDAGGMDSGS